MGHLLRVLAARSVGVCDDSDSLSAQRVRKFFSPCSRRAGSRSRQAESLSSIGIFLAFDDKHITRGQHLGEPIENAANASQVPSPSTFAIWSALAEVLRIEAHILIKQRSALVSVGVLGSDSRLWQRFREEVFPSETRSVEHLF